MAHNNTTSTETPFQLPRLCSNGAIMGNRDKSKFAWWRREMLGLQKFNFTGAIKYDSNRKPLDTTQQIISLCLRHIASNELIEKALLAVCKQHSINFGQFAACCNENWMCRNRAGDIVFTVFKHIGYGGNIDQLWLSVYGTWKISTAQAHAEPVSEDSMFGSRTYRVPGSRIFPSGQSRSSGSHGG